MTATQSNDPIKLVTPVDKHTVMVKPFASARLRKETRNVFLQYVSIDSKQLRGKNQKQLEQMDGETITQFEDKIPAEAANQIKEIMLKNMIISIALSGTSGEITDREELVDTCLEMRDVDYDYLVVEIDKVVKGSDMDEDKKKESVSSTPES